MKSNWWRYFYVDRLYRHWDFRILTNIIFMPSWLFLMAFCKNQRRVPGSYPRDTWYLPSWHLGVSLVTPGSFPHDTWEFPSWHLGVSFRCVRVLRCRITQFPLVILNSLSKNYSRMLSETWIHMACPWYTPFTYVFWYCECNNNCNSQYWSHIWQKVHPPISEDSNSSIPTTEKSFDFL